MTLENPRCIVADDHPALAGAVCSFLGKNGFQVIGPLPDGRELVAATLAAEPDLALVDYNMPGVDGAELLLQLREAAPSTRAVVYTGDADESLAIAAMDAGAFGVVAKESPLADVVRALRSVLDGRPYIDPALAVTVTGRSESPPSLTEREREVLTLMANGLKHEEIGRELSISGETVRTHLKKASDRLGAATRTQAVATALRLGLIS